MKRYNYRYDGKAISKAQFLSSVPENWEDELKLYHWKKMKICSCERTFEPNRGYYTFPNRVRLDAFKVITVEHEFAGKVEALISDWIYEKVIEKKTQEVRFYLKGLVRTQLDKVLKQGFRGILDDLIWNLYSMEL